MMRDIYGQPMTGNEIQEVESRREDSFRLIDERVDNRLLDEVRQEKESEEE